MTGETHDLITVQLTPEDAELFVLFRRYQDKFKDMIEAKMFEIRNGSATIDFSPQGHMMDIKFNVVAFKRNKI
jgi:hypothetical protein